MLLALNTNVIALKGLRDVTTGSYVNDATLTVSLYDITQEANLDKGIAATAISGASGVSMAYKASSNGEYYGVIAASVQLTIGTDVIARITSSNYGIDRTIRTPVRRG